MEIAYFQPLQDAAHFLAQPAWNIGIPVAYFLSTMAGYTIMRNCEPFKTPTWFKIIYNFCQVTLSLYCLVFGMPVVCDMLAHPFGLNMPFGGEHAKSLHYCVCVHFLSKFLDYVDTFLIIVNKKDRQLSVLHVYHHSSISAVWGFLIYTGVADGTVCFGAWINALVHSIMYTYYGLTAAKVNTKPLKQWVTSVQLTQFSLCIIHAIVVCLFDTTLPTYLPWIQFAYHCTMITLFGQFYLKTYAKKGKAQKKKE